MRNYNSADASLEKKKGEQNRTPFESNYIAYGFISKTPAGLEEITICKGRKINSAGISSCWTAIAHTRAVSKITPTLVVCLKSNWCNESTLSSSFRVTTHIPLPNSKLANRGLFFMEEKVQFYPVYPVLLKMTHHNYKTENLHNVAGPKSITALRTGLQKLLLLII